MPEQGYRDEMAVEGLRLYCLLGTKEWEKMAQQEVVVDFKFWMDVTLAAKSDTLSETVNMGKVTKAITKYVQSASHSLLESLAHEILRILLVDFQLQEAEVKVRKPNQFKNAASAAVTIRRNRTFFAASNGKM